MIESLRKLVATPAGSGAKDRAFDPSIFGFGVAKSRHAACRAGNAVACVGG
ncbi:MAG: hypothetical protein FWD57_06200 [Polyangiaceae bacterium]|nr:hypothetical protein [Polyangiaceae bacterium]